MKAINRVGMVENKLYLTWILPNIWVSINSAKSETESYSLFTFFFLACWGLAMCCLLILGEMLSLGLRLLVLVVVLVSDDFLLNTCYHLPNCNE